MAKREYTSARQVANAKYDEKTYVNYLFKLRKDEDADIIMDIEAAKSKGINKREWLRELFEGK